MRLWAREESGLENAGFPFLPVFTSKRNSHNVKFTISEVDCSVAFSSFAVPCSRGRLRLAPEHSRHPRRQPPPLAAAPTPPPPRPRQPLTRSAPPWVCPFWIFSYEWDRTPCDLSCPASST